MRPAAILAAGILLVGCEQTVKRTLPPDIRTITIELSDNGTGEIILAPVLEEEVRRAFRLDGRLDLVNRRDGADSVLEIVITEYTKQPARFDSNNVVQEYRMRLVADLKLVDLKEGKVLWRERGPESTAARGGSIRKLERFLNFVVVPADGLPAETEGDAQRRMLKEFSLDIVLKVIEGW